MGLSTDDFGEKPPVSEQSSITVHESMKPPTTHGGIDREKRELDPENVDPEPQTQVLQLTKSANEAPHSIFKGYQITFIVSMASLAALFSPLTANIYYPALNILAEDLHVSNTLINLSITTYMIFQGLAPAFIGSFSDEHGRRPSYVICFVIYIAACIGLALQNNYAALMVLRCLQSTGSSGTVALANAVVADIATSSERGKYIGYASMGALLGPTVGPIIGAILAQYLGWRSIFWFLAIFGGVVMSIIAVAMPETCRKIVGNGTSPPQNWNYSLITYLARRKAQKAGIVNEARPIIAKAPLFNPLNTLYIILDKESGIVLMNAGLIFAGFYMILAGIPSLFAEKYGFNVIQIGLCYIPSGVGSFVSAVVMGRLIDWNFRRHAKMIGMEVKKGKQQDLTNFPIEAARLEVMLPLIFASCILIVAYGWTIEKSTSLAGVLILNLVLTFTISGTFQGLSTLVVDLNRNSPGTATAAMNLARCWLGAAGTAIVVPLMNSVGIGWTSVVIAGVWLALSPISFIVIKYGPAWRAEKKAKLDKAKKEEEDKRRANAGLEEGVAAVEATQ